MTITTRDPKKSSRERQAAAPVQRSVSRRRLGRGRSTGNAQIFPRRKKPARIVRRGVLLGLVALSLVLVTLSYQQGSSAHLRSVQLGVLQVVAPVEKGLSKAWEPVRNAYDWTATLLRATDENPELRKRISDLEERSAEYEVSKDENARLRKLLNLVNRGDLPGMRNRVVASVIARSPTALDRSIVADVGSHDGVQVDDPVLVPGGLLGRVQEVSGTTATIALILNRAEAVSIVIQGRKAGGVIRAVSADGGSPVMQVDYVTQAASVKVGDMVATSGWRAGPLQSIYPKGIPVGMVTSVGNSPTDLYKTVQVTPFADFDRIDEVVVLVADKGSRVRGGSR